MSPALTLSMRREIDRCLIALNYVDDSSFTEQKQEPVSQTELEREVAILRADKDAFVSTLISLQKEKDQLRSELAKQTRKLEEMEMSLTQAHPTIEEVQTERARTRPIVASDVIVAFSQSHFRMIGPSIIHISEGWESCYTKPVSKGIHRLSIRTMTAHALLGVCDAAEYPNYLTSAVFQSQKAAMMYSFDGNLMSAGKNLVQNTKPQKGQEWSAEADLEKRTLHFFIDGVQQQHHFINIPVPLVFAIDVKEKDIPIEITFWGELKQSHVTFEGTGHNLG
ncbi:hypothetical protein BLNAU_1283 [Blattamonas nauphoetae]|uniref:Uncharacterized protein n=1 Tax=Blattamonas nauphoetae TaxID=2049346 RepID=A0ABQ9YJ08_9EUKA|nr:hypothetical protein BLNAU_1283 [Blattamonas nauphoetae]